MIAKKPKRDKQLLTEQLWLHYLNDVAFRNGIITTDAYHKMIHTINNRTKIAKQEKGDQNHG